MHDAPEPHRLTQISEVKTTFQPCHNQQTRKHPEQAAKVKRYQIKTSAKPAAYMASQRNIPRRVIHSVW